MFATGGADGDLRVMDARARGDGVAGAIDRAHDGAAVHFIEWSASGREFLTSGGDGVVRAWARSIFTLVPIRPRPRGERRFLRTLPVASLRPPLGFNTRPRRLSTPLLTPFNSTPTLARVGRPVSGRKRTTGGNGALVRDRPRRAGVRARRARGAPTADDDARGVRRRDARGDPGGRVAAAVVVRDARETRRRRWR